MSSWSQLEALSNDVQTLGGSRWWSAYQSDSIHTATQSLVEESKESRLLEKYGLGALVIVSMHPLSGHTILWHQTWQVDSIPKTRNQIKSNKHAHHFGWFCRYIPWLCSLSTWPFRWGTTAIAECIEWALRRNVSGGCGWRSDSGHMHRNLSDGSPEWNGWSRWDFFITYNYLN